MQLAGRLLTTVLVLSSSHCHGSVAQARAAMKVVYQHAAPARAHQRILRADKSRRRDVATVTPPTRSDQCIRHCDPHCVRAHTATVLSLAGTDRRKPTAWQHTVR